MPTTQKKDTRTENISVKKETASSVADAQTELFNSTQDLFFHGVSFFFGAFRASLHAASTFNRDLMNEVSRFSQYGSNQVPLILEKNTKVLEEMIEQTDRTIENMNSQINNSRQRIVIHEEIDYSKLAKMVAEELKNNP
ncbi:MAG TPA: hypothetical protein VFG10_17570 [Saprospiraceae bacterium]|nr:hypothetical protein [Saprospiraceae bacterium]